MFNFFQNKWDSEGQTLLHKGDALIKLEKESFKKN